MNETILVIVQGLFVYLLLWWVVFFISLQWAVPDFWFRLPWKRKGRIVYLGRRHQAFGPVAKKFIASSLIAVVVWTIVFPLVKSDYLSFERASHSLDHYSE